MLDLEPALKRLEHELLELERAIRLPVPRAKRWALDAAIGGLAYSVRQANPVKQRATELNGMARRAMCDADYQKEVQNGA